jgi:hypothetical protein
MKSAMDLSFQLSKSKRRVADKSQIISIAGINMTRFTRCKTTAGKVSVIADRAKKYNRKLTNLGCVLLNNSGVVNMITLVRKLDIDQNNPSIKETTATLANEEEIIKSFLTRKRQKYTSTIWNANRIISAFGRIFIFINALRNSSILRKFVGETANIGVYRVPVLGCRTRFFLPHF